MHVTTDDGVWGIGWPKLHYQEYLLRDIEEVVIADFEELSLDTVYTHAELERIAHSSGSCDTWCFVALVLRDGTQPKIAIRTSTKHFQALVSLIRLHNIPIMTCKKLSD